MVRQAVPPNAIPAVAMCAALGLLLGGCSNGSKHAAGGARSGAPSDGAQLQSTPANGGHDAVTSRGITVPATRARIGKVIVHTPGAPVSGKLNAAGTVWHSTWALNVSKRYTVTATATATSGRRLTRT